MDQASVETNLADLYLPAIRFFQSIDSTNDEAWRWFDSGAPHAALVIADEQTAGRGRLRRHWVTIPASGLAFSLVLLPPAVQSSRISRLTGLGALAASQALQKLYALPAQIKWPNDILLENHKAGGVLVEARWNGADLKAAVIGIGINIAPASISPGNLPQDTLIFPVTCVENAVGHPVDRMKMLHAILDEFFYWFSRLDTHEFIQTWEDKLAYRGQWVELSKEAHDLPAGQDANLLEDKVVKVVGLASDGALRILHRSGKLASVQVGEVHLRPATPAASG